MVSWLFLVFKGGLIALRVVSIFFDAPKRAVILVVEVLCVNIQILGDQIFDYVYPKIICTLELDESLFFLAEYRNKDLLVTKQPKLDCFFQKASLSFAEGHASF